MSICCPTCDSTNTKKNGHIHNGKQNHYCKQCFRPFVLCFTRKLVGWHFFPLSQLATPSITGFLSSSSYFERLVVASDF